MASLLAVGCGGDPGVASETSTGAGPGASTVSSLSSTLTGAETSTRGGDGGSTSDVSSSTSSGFPDATGTTTGPGADEGTTGGSTDTTGGEQLYGWTERLSASDLWPPIFPATEAVELVVDPHTTDRLALRVTDSIAVSGWAIWDDGDVSGPELDEYFAYSDGAGFDSEGRFTAAYELGEDVHLMHWTGAGGPWHGLMLMPESAFFDWPPRRLTVGMGAPARSLVHSDEALWHSTPWTFMPQSQWSMGIFCGSNCGIQRVVYRPGVADELIAVTLGGMMMRCEPDIDISWSCTETGAAPTGELGMWVTLANPDRLVMKGQGALFISEDAGATFSSVDTPTEFFDVALSPLDPERIVIWNSTGLDPLLVTDDLGQTWSPLPLPETQVQSLGDVAIDGAGTIFALRGGGLFSHPADLD